MLARVQTDADPINRGSAYALRAENARLRERVEDLEYEIACLKGEGESAEPWREPPELVLTNSERRVMRYLCDRSPMTATKEGIYGVLYGAETEVEMKIVDVFICKLRRKIEGLPLAIVTQWGEGYLVEREHAERWQRWCRNVGEGLAPGDDFKFSDDADGYIPNRALTPLDVETIRRRLRRGDTIDAVAERLCLPLRAVERMNRQLIKSGRLGDAGIR